ncbi:MAG: ankyrin repeat domain-containing protein [Bacteroidota bacterium]
MNLETDPDIFDAIEFGDIETVKNYWTDHINIDWQDNKGMSLIMYAVYYADIPIIELLLTKNPNLHLRSNDGQTVFDIAKARDNEDLLEMLSNI